MSGAVSLADITARYESEWVLVEDPQLNEQLEVLGGRVLYHSKDRDEVYQKAVELRPKHSAVLYTGTMPQGTAIVL